MCVGLMSKYDTFGPEEIKVTGRACLEHRASYTGGTTSFVSELVAVADRGPIDMEEFITRTVKFAFEKYKGNEGLIFDHAINHLKDKISKNGYMWKTYPPIGWYFNALEIYALKEVVEDERRLTDKILQNISHFLSTK